MLIDNQVKQYLAQNYRKTILTQIPESYSPHNIIDLSKTLKSNRQIGSFIILQFPRFQQSAKDAIATFMGQEGFDKPEYGIHLLITVTNCPLPMQNIKSPQFQMAGFQQSEGIMVYLKDVFVSQIGQQQMFLFSATEQWAPRCNCEEKQNITRTINRSLISVIQSNANKQDKLKNNYFIQPHKCQNCTKAYHFVQRTNQIYLNCHKLKLLLPKRNQKQALFQNSEFIAYGQTNIASQLSLGSIISCCSYIFYRPALIKAMPKQSIIVKSQYSAYVINIQVHSNKANLLTIRPQNSQFFYQLSNIGLPQKHCKNLSETQPILYNYQKIVQSVDKFKFSYLPPSMLTTLKLSLINSVCNHHANKSLHLCLISQDIQMALQLMYINGISIKRWPSQYDNSSLINWLKYCRGSIVIVLGPTKKDIQLLQQFFSKKMVGFENISITFWLLCQTNPKKDINIDYFGIVLDLTTQKNIHICKQAIQQSIDFKLSAFIQDQYQSHPTTIAKQKRLKNVFEKMERKQNKMTEDQQIEQEQQSRKIIQTYYLKCRDLKKTHTSTITYLYQLAKGFSCLRAALNGQDWLVKDIHISIIDSVLAIFLDQESARNKISSNNTIFGAQISKLILNQQQCEISFWDFLSQQDGTITQFKNYMPKSQMFKKMLIKLNALLFEDQFIMD